MTDRFTEMALRFAERHEDMSLKELKILAGTLRGVYNMAIEEAAIACSGLAVESCGGTGAGGEQYEIAAKRVKKLLVMESR